MSSPIRTAGRTTLPDGHVSLIVLRRDIAQNAPDRGAVRVIARVVRSTTFRPAEKPTTSPVLDEWTMRGTAFDMGVAPISEQPEMLSIRNENSDFILPAGRYGLVIKGQAYDFAVAGEITEAFQCVERTEAANGVFYSECRAP